MTPDPRPVLQLVVDGQQIEVPDRGVSLLEVLREDLRLTSVKDGCSPQGQCGCCTVLVDGQPRVACVTPARRVAGRSVVTVDGLEPTVREGWATAFWDTGASQCGFCTPGIVCRLEGLRAKTDGQADHGAVEQALLAHLCRCTGWRTILDAWDVITGSATPGGPEPLPHTEPASDRDAERHTVSQVAVRGRDRGGRAGADDRATIESGGPQVAAPHVAVGRQQFADDTAPPDALVAVPDGQGGWAVGESLAEARLTAGKVQGRRTTVDAAPPLDLPPGDWAATLRTSWVEPGYLEPDASWSAPGGTAGGPVELPFTPLANGGAFGGKLHSPVVAAAAQLADDLGRPVRALLGREDVVRLGPKRPPVAGGANADGTGVIRVVATPGVADAIALVAPGLRVEEVAVAGPPTSVDLRAAGWAEAVVLLAGARGATRPVTDPRTGATAEAAIDGDGVVRVRLDAGEVLDEVVLRSYAIGAAHMALSWMSSEGIAVDADGTIHDLTIRSFGILRAVDTPPIEVTPEHSDRPAVRGSDAVFAAVAAAAWLHAGCPTDWPTGTRWR